MGSQKSQKPLSEWAHTPLPDSAIFSQFTGGSYLKGDDGTYCVGYTTATPFNAEAAHLPMATSAPQTEFYTLTWVYTLASNQTANIYTDTIDTFGVALMILENYGSNMASLLRVEIQF